MTAPSSIGVKAGGTARSSSCRSSAEDGAGWLAVFRDLTARGLTGVRLVTSDRHRGLVAAVGATLPGASWQLCRSHYPANLMSATPLASWPWVRAMLHSVYDQPDSASLHAQYDRLLYAVVDKLPRSPSTSTRPAPTCWVFTAFPKKIWRQIWSKTHKNASTGRSAAGRVRSSVTRDLDAELLMRLGEDTA